jgi:hypothetical protein
VVKEEDAVLPALADEELADLLVEGFSPCFFAPPLPLVDWIIVGVAALTVVPVLEIAKA